MQTVTYYSGGKYSLYGYKKYDDIRLVLIPELDLGFYGGDPDNFTYPRYNLDATFWRAYDAEGNPMNTSANYFKFNAAGAVEDEPVFVVGNPGSTERYRTVAQLEYDRDYRYPMTYKFLKNRNDVMVAEYEEMIKDPAKEFEAQALLNTIANIGNGMKAYGGIVGGLNNEALFGRKVAMENHIKAEYSEVDKAAKCLTKGDKITKDKDMMMQAARILVPRYQEAVQVFRGSTPLRKGLEAKIANQAFNRRTSSCDHH